MTASKFDMSQYVEGGGFAEREVVPAPWPGIFSSSAFIAGFTPPDYLFDGILQRRFIYSMTGATGSGKTAIALRLSAHCAKGLSLAGRSVEQGPVLYLAGENPDDVRMRWIGMACQMGFDLTTIGVHFLPGPLSIPSIRERVVAEAERLGGFSLVIVDTSAAYFEGVDENDNRTMGAYARMLRSLTKIPGGPCVLILAHPVKNANSDNLLPRGGGAFVAEMDGNLTSTKDDTVTRMHWQGKFRGPDFDPITFELIEVRPPELVDSKGRPIPTVVAAVIGAQEESQREDEARSDEEQILRAIRDNPRASYTTLIRVMDWPPKSKSRISRVAARLERDRLIRKVRGKWRLTDAGKKETADAETPA